MLVFPFSDRKFVSDTFADFTLCDRIFQMRLESCVVLDATYIEEQGITAFRNGSDKDEKCKTQFE